MQYFEVLGLDAPPKDRREVKTAYSKQLKRTRPEEDPEGFMKLRHAHDEALNRLAFAAQQAAYEAEEKPDVDTRPVVTFADMVEEADTDSSAYATGHSQALDAPAQESFDVGPSGYAIGPSPTLDAPAQPRAAPPPPPLDQDLLALLNSLESRNDREQWNSLFRKARQLNIDDYVDFEGLLLHRILDLHGFYDEDNPHFDNPQKMPKLLSAPITASLFKTMSWDQVGKFNYQQSYRIDWLERRMGLRLQNPVQLETTLPPPAKGAGFMRWFWPGLGVLFALVLLIDLLAT